LRRVLAAAGLEPAQCAAVGDDLPDLPLLRNCGAAAAVADACPQVRAAAQYVTRAAGGQGAVREVIEWLLTAQGRWQAAVARFRVEEWDDPDPEPV
jgi:3-deoxy-D-manno-octulosonate 8-phosphate phosphatase (KDO 8-P phosphatase)